MIPALVGLAAAGLFGLCVASIRNHLDRAPDDWSDAAARPELWASGARCPVCGASGGLVELIDGETVHECLACVRRHVRTQRG